MNKSDHWEQIYNSKKEDEVSWFQPSPVLSLRLIKDTGLPPDARIVDVGGGTSRLVDRLLDAGYSDLAVLDITDGGLARARERLGGRAAAVKWIVSDVIRFKPRGKWDLWHDRAVFHFLVDRGERMAYRRTMQRALAPRGHVILATFGEHGPESCSGLPVMRYGADSLHAELGEAFVLRRSEVEHHLTPSGAVQEFQYCWFQRRS